MHLIELALQMLHLALYCLLAVHLLMFLLLRGHCFICDAAYFKKTIQSFFDQFDGVVSTEVGYANGPDEAPTYQDVCKSSGHAETVRIVYDETRISLAELLNYYFMVIDPFSVNRQGNDTGIQYRTGIYYTDEDQYSEAKAVYKAEEEKAGEKLAVELKPLQNYFTAEEYHQKYLVKNPGGYCHIPKTMFELEQE